MVGGTETVWKGIAIALAERAERGSLAGGLSHSFFTKKWAKIRLYGEEESRVAFKRPIFLCQLIRDNFTQPIAQITNLSWHSGPYLLYASNNATCILEDRKCASLYDIIIWYLF